jgi:hypothetical protein
MKNRPNFSQDGFFVTKQVLIKRPSLNERPLKIRLLMNRAQEGKMACKYLM